MMILQIGILRISKGFQIVKFWKFDNFRNLSISEIWLFSRLVNNENFIIFRFVKFGKFDYFPNWKFLEFSKFENKQISRILFPEIDKFRILR